MEDEDESDYLEDESPPQVRPVRMMIASIIGVPAIIIEVLSIVSFSEEKPEDPHADVSVALEPLGYAIAVLWMLFWGIVSLACFFTLVSALLEARRARSRNGGEA
jgi:hypothetical protein